MKEHAYLSTIAYFDLFDFPLTAQEFFKYLWQEKISWEEHLNNLKELETRGVVRSKQGYYYLPGREETIVKRANSVLPTESKLRRAKFAAKLISSIPFLEAIFVCNSVSGEIANEGSDIDFFIVTSAKRIWLVRFLSNLILRLFGLRTGKTSADRVCLSFYVDRDHLDLSSLRIASDDIYLATWLSQLLPIYDPKDIHEEILKKNEWLKVYLPNLGPIETGNKIKQKKFFERILSGSLGDAAEMITRKIQWKVLRPDVKAKASLQGRDVVLNDAVLKFHENDARSSIRERWLQKIQIYVK